MGILTIGHSTRGADELVGLLSMHGVDLLADVRTIPRSRRNPQFNHDVLPQTLAAAGIAYRHFKDLGGLRKPRPDSPNNGWENAGFRGFADYMQTPGFEAGLEGLLERARTHRIAIMCAEAVPWRCHRSLIADVLTARGFEVAHITGKGEPKLHCLTSFARVEGGRVTYPFALHP